MWNPFKKIKPEVVIEKSKQIDWDKVKTVEDVVCILSRLGVTRFAKVPEDEWNNPQVGHLLGNTITEITYVGGFADKISQYNEQENHD